MKVLLFVFAAVAVASAARCYPPCQHWGICVLDNVCFCRKGWTGSSCEIPNYYQECLNGGTSTRPGHCECAQGWTGSQCEIRRKADSSFVFQSSRCYLPCPHPTNLTWVCGNDGKSYVNECAMTVRACLDKKAIVAVHKGKCLIGEKRCMFPCLKIFNPVCGSDGQMYPNECVMRVQSCKTKLPITTVFRGHKRVICEECKFLCTRESNDLKHICGSNGKSYLNECMMRHEACATKTAIIRVYDGECGE